MLRQLETRFDLLEANRRTILDCVGSYPEAQQLFQPGPDQWSMVQVIEHLVLVEEGTLRVFERGPPPEETVSLRSRAMLLFIYLIFRFGIRVKLPMRSLAPANTPLVELQARWQDARNALGTFLETLEPKHMVEPRFHHPVAGWLTMRQGLDFLARHIRHHERQVRRVSRAPGFSSLS